MPNIEFSMLEMEMLEDALAVYHNRILDKRRNMRPSERAIWAAEVRRMLGKVRTEMGTTLDNA